MDQIRLALPRRTLVFAGLFASGAKAALGADGCNDDGQPMPPATQAGSRLGQVSPQSPQGLVVQVEPGTFPRLSGVAMGPAGKVAVFSARADGYSTVMREGDVLGGLMLVRIDKGAVTLVGADGAEMVCSLQGSRTATSGTDAPPRPTLPMAPGTTEARAGRPWGGRSSAYVSGPSQNEPR